MLKPLSSAACFLVFLAGAVTCAPSGADAAVVCQNDKRPNRFKIRAACKPGKETVVGEIGAPADPGNPTPVAPPADPAPTATSNTRIFGARKIAETAIEYNESVWLDFGTPRTYEPTPPAGITAVAVGQLPSFRFSTTGTSDVVISFSAQCRIASHWDGHMLHVQFELDGEVLDGPNDRSNLCASKAFNPTPVPASVSYLIQDVPAGLHEVRAIAGYWPSGAGTSSSLSDIELTITAVEHP